MNNLHIVSGSKRKARHSDLPTILLVEDDESFVDIFTELMKEEKFPIQVSLAQDGHQALTFLNKNRPNLILLDLWLPKQNGLEVLKKIKTNPDSAEIPVIIFSSTEEPDVINLCYRLHANSYIVKPHGLKEYKALIEDIVNFWFQTAELPREIEVDEN